MIIKIQTHLFTGNGKRMYSGPRITRLCERLLPESSHLAVDGFFFLLLSWRIVLSLLIQLEKLKHSFLNKKENSVFYILTEVEMNNIITILWNSKEFPTWLYDIL